ncbi:MAG: thiamine pyrophosphate-binding protein [Betaproteobacteria bacterium]|nr:thiamine pyrophosphate-binding protein [Betaproteobacteria bacterium]
MTPHTPALPATQLDGQTVAQLLLRYLALEGVDTLFGIPGAAVMHLLAELKNQRDKFRYVVARQETGAAYIADGYARVSGKLGVVLVTSGPGATNALTGTMNAQNSGVSLLTITGEVAERYYGMGYLQEGTDASLNIDAVYGNASGYSVIVTNESNFQTLFTQALRDALGLPHRAAHISLPDDVAATPVASVRFPNAAHNYRARPHGADPHQVQLAFQRLAGVARPLIFLGSGVREVLQGERLASFTRMIERFAIPVMTTPDAKAIFPESHPMSLRCFGMAYCEWSKDYLLPSRVDPKLPDGYDSLLVLGTQLGGFSTNKWDPALLPRESLVQVDLDQTVIGRVFPLDFGAVAELGAFIDELCRTAHAAHPHAGQVKARRELLARIHQRSPYLDPANRNSTKAPILPQAVMKCISDTVPPGSNLFVDSGNCVGFALHYLAVDPPTRVFSALSMGPMGFAVGAVIGAKLAAPQSVCLAICGDGAFLMHGNEVSTAEANGVAAIWVVLDNNDLAMVSQGMNQFFPDKSGIWNDYYALGKPDVAQFARSLGADAYDVKTVEDMQHALGAAINASGLNGKPQVIAVHIDASQIPPYYQDIKPPVHGGSR